MSLHAVPEIPKPKATAALEPKDVHIKDRAGHVDKPQITVSQSAQEQVTWYAFQNDNATIVFSTEEGSPFQSAVFHVPGGGSVSSGLANKDAKYQPYKYSVVGSTGVTDPEVIIDK